MFVHILLVIYVFSREIELVKSADKLEFWERDPQFDARRAIEDPKYKNHPNHDSSKPPTRFTKVKSKDKAPIKRTTTDYITSEKEKKPAPTVARSRNRGRSEETTKWPKLQQHRYKQKQRKDELRSTRISELHLLQQPEEDSTSKYQKLEENDKDTVLSPYSIKQQLTDFASNFQEANITVEVIGRTVEYNDIVMLKVTERKSELGKYFRADESKYVDEVPEKKIIFIVHGLSVMGISNIPCLYSIADLKVLLSFYFAHLDKFDIFLIPMANPDGFVLREKGGRKNLWNKNMSPQGACPGVALDRNFDVSWNSTASVSSCSQHFPGVSPFSEAETRAIRDVLHHYSHKINGYMHVHSGSYDYQSFKGDAILYPKGYTDVQSDDDKYIDLRGEIDEAMKNASFQVISVTVDTLHNWYGKISGSSVDYASTIYGIPYAMELVMQPFQDMGSKENYSWNALNEIWRRVIDVIFNNIWRNTKNSDT
ncbi:carboxypeptidase O-like [Ostrinia furnacalis]|uniref:carboxypeptidase O-like n=1 Tax=Ostrinia furnacalis TaxID=93504 RepID=UPI00103E58A5|nr:carboxypeptidase O-like [Ostrinia furnacalis]